MVADWDGDGKRLRIRSGAGFGDHRCIGGIDVFLFLVGFTHDGILEMMRPTVCPVHEQKKVR